MKSKLVYAATVALLLSGCSVSPPKPVDYSSLTQCDVSGSDSARNAKDKAAFISALQLTAYTAQANETVEKMRMDSLGYMGYRDDIADSISKCLGDKNYAILKDGKLGLEKIKAKTKNPEERKALIAAFSSWESYVQSPSEDGERELTSKISYYENI